MKISDYIISNPEILNGTPVFKGTRVPVETFFDHLEAGVSIDEFIEDFPTVSKEQAVTLLEAANKLFTSKNIEQLYEVIA